jgi:hypothetical protein
MALFGGGTQKQTTKVKLTPEQKALAAAGTQNILSFARNPPPPPTGTGIAEFNPTQLASQEAALGAASQQGNLASGAQGANQFLFSDVLSPDTNPYLMQYADYATDPIIQKGYELLGAARGGADATGQYGGTRQGLVESNAIDATLRNYGGARADIFNKAYGQGLEALVKGLALAPETAGLVAQPARTMATVGDIRQAQEQAKLTEQRQQAQLAELWPLLIGQEVLGSVGMIPSGGTVSTANAPKTSIVGGALGGAATGASIGGMIGGPVGAGVGAAGGTGLGTLMALLS